MPVAEAAGGALVGAAIVSAIASLIGTGVNTYSTMKTNQKLMERDDTAVSRRAKDLMNAGLSPVLAAGSGASTSQLNAPQVDTESIARSPALVMAMKQQYANLGQTEASTALTRFQAENENIRKAFYNGQIDLQAAQLEHQNLQNAWFVRDMETSLGLRDKQSKQIDADILRTTQNTALLRAQTEYQQEQKKKLLFDTDIVKIERALKHLDFMNYYGDKFYQRFGSDQISQLSKSITNTLNINGQWSYPSDFDFQFYEGY